MQHVTHSRATLCIASPDGGLRRRAAEAFPRQAYDVVPATSLDQLAAAAGSGLSLVLVDPRLAGLGDRPLVQLRALPDLHSCALLLLTEEDIRGLRSKAPDAELADLMIRVHSQVSGAEQITLLNRINTSLTASPEMDPTMRAVLEVAASVLEFDTGSLFLLDPLNRLRIRAARGYQLNEEQLRSFDLNEGVVGWVVRNRRPSIVGDSTLDERFATFYGSSGSRSMLAAPILLGERVIGALTLVRRFPAEPFTDADLLPVATLANSAAIALENARLHEQERTLAVHLEELHELYGKEKAIVDKLEEYDRLYTQVVSTVSHELKTPLMSIRGFAQMIRDGDVADEEARDFGGEIHDNAVRLSRYVERILQEDSVHNGRATLQLEEVDLGSLIDEVVHSLGNLAGDRHRLVNLVNGNTPPVSADPDKVSRIILNLVSNAIKYSPDGGEVTLTASASGREVELVVEDQGLGIPAEARQRIFDRFYRVESAQSRNISGTGLGLSIVKGLVELHGGRIWVEPGNQRGSRFVVTLPQVGAPDTAALPADDRVHTPCLEET